MLEGARKIYLKTSQHPYDYEFINSVKNPSLIRTLVKRRVNNKVHINQVYIQSLLV